MPKLQKRRLSHAVRRIFVGLCIAAGGLLTTGWSPVPMSPGSAIMPLSAKQYDDQVAVMSRLLQQNGSDALLGYVDKQVASNPAFASQCHPLLHAVGHVAFRYYGSFEAAMKHQIEACNSGFSHGIIEAYFLQLPAAGLEHALQTACLAPAAGMQAAFSFRQWQCYHGIGHGLMLAKGRDTTKALAACRLLPQHDGNIAAKTCANGVFMENFTTIDHVGQVRTGATASFSSCQKLAADNSNSCYYYAPSAYLDQHNDDYRATYRWCQTAAKPPFVANCVAGLGGQSMQRRITSPAITAALCSSLDRLYQASCVQGAISLYIQSKASSAAAKPLCDKEFKRYHTICRNVIDSKHQSLSI